MDLPILETTKQKEKKNLTKKTCFVPSCFVLLWADSLQTEEKNYWDKDDPGHTISPATVVDDTVHLRRQSLPGERKDLLPQAIQGEHQQCPGYREDDRGGLLAAGRAMHHIQMSRD